VGVKSLEWLKLNPHPNLPPARGKALSAIDSVEQADIVYCLMLMK